MEWLEVHFLRSDEDISVDVVEGEHSAREDTRLLHNGLLRNTFDQAHVEGSFVKFLDDHLIDFLLHVVVIFLPHVVVQEHNPLLQVLYLLVRWLYLDDLFQIL